jgi:phospholipase C
MKHDPFVYFHAIRDDPTRCSHVVPLAQLGSDLAANTVPDFAMVVPNLCHSTHDCSIKTGDDWLASVVPTIMASPAWKDGGVLIVTYDEGEGKAGCCGNAAGGTVASVLASPSGPFGYASDVPYSHYSLLRSIEDNWALPHLGYAGDAKTLPMTDLFPPPGN